MKKKIVFINLFASLTVLFAMLFQMAHSYEHAYKQITEKHCSHESSDGRHQLTHVHSVEHNCHICHFEFSSFIPNAFETLNFTKINSESPCLFSYSKQVSNFFKGSLFALRAPPVNL